MQRAEVEALGHRLVRAMTERNLTALGEILHPEIRFRSLIASLGLEFQGVDGFRAYFRELDGSFADVRWEFADVVACRDDVAVVHVRFQARGRGSGVEIDAIHPQVWHFREGKGIANDVYTSLEEALAAAGFAEREILLRRVFEAVTEGRAHEVADLLDPEFVLVSVMAGREFVGVDGLQDWYEDVSSYYDDARWEIHEVTGLGEKDAVRWRFQGLARASGIPFDIEMSQLWSYRDGRAARVDVFPDAEGALLAARSP